MMATQFSLPVLAVVAILALPTAAHSQGSRGVTSIQQWGYPTLESAIPVNVVPRSKLGSADALRIDLPVGRITVIGRDTDSIRYTVQRVAPSNVSAIDSSRMGSTVSPDGVTHSYTAPAIHIWVATWNRPLRPDTTALRMLPPFRRFEEHLTATGMQIVLPWPDPWTQDSLHFRPFVGSAVEEYLRMQDRQKANGTAYVPTLGGGYEIRVEVPRNLSSISLRSSVSATIVVQDFDGELNVTSARGDVYIGHLGGPAVVEVTEGNIEATIRWIPAGLAVSLMSGKGDVTALIGSPDSVLIEARARGAEFNHILSLNPLRDSLSQSAALRLAQNPNLQASIYTVFPGWPQGIAPSPQGTLLPRLPLARSPGRGRLMLKALDGSVRYGAVGWAKVTTLPRWLK